jgi:hypothetical protein
MIDIEEQVTRQRAKKDRKQWCRGKVGRRHDYQVTSAVATAGGKTTPMRRLYEVWIACSACGRKDDYVGLFGEGEEWTPRRKGNDRLRKRIDEIAQRNKSDAALSGVDAKGIGRESTN